MKRTILRSSQQPVYAHDSVGAHSPVCSPLRRRETFGLKCLENVVSPRKIGSKKQFKEQIIRNLPHADNIQTVLCGIVGGALTATCGVKHFDSLIVKRREALAHRL